MTRARQMRVWLAANGQATATQIREGLGLTPRQLKSTLYELVSTGLVVQHGAQRPRTYTIGRAAREWGINAPDLLAARKAKRLAYNAKRRRKGERTQAQIQAEAIQARIDRMAERLAADNAQRRTNAITRGHSVPAAVMGSPEPITQVAEPESVAEWMLRTGQRPQVLSDGEVSPAFRLRRIGRFA